MTLVPSRAPHSLAFLLIGTAASALVLLGYSHVAAADAPNDSDEFVQYPFLCTTEENDLGQPHVDNQEEHGVPVYPEEDGEPQPDQDPIGWSRDCAADVRYDYYYVDTSGRRNHLWTSGDENPPDQPDDVAMTTTIDDKEIPFYIRQERGTINRFVYSIAVPVPWEEIASVEDGDPGDFHDQHWNGRLTYGFGGGAGIGYSQGEVRSRDAFLMHRGDGDIGDSDALARGFAVAASSGTRAFTHYNLEVGADTATQLKHHFTQEYGDALYTVGIGSSGGAIQQYVYAEHAPELLDAAIPVRSYPDMTTQTNHVGDCELLERYMDVDAAENPDLWDGFFDGDDHDNRQLVQGMNASSDLRSTECVEGWRGLMPLHFNPNWFILANWGDIVGGEVGTVLDEDEIVETEWTHFADARNVYGTHPDTGFARFPWDNVGIQYGLRAFTDGEITAEQFLDLNARVGSWVEQHEMQQERQPYFPAEGEPDPWSSINMNLSPDDGQTPAPRREGDLEAIESVRQSGLYFSGEIDIPVIDVREYLEGELDMHNSHQSFAARQRIEDAMGHSDHHVIWFTGDDRDEAETQLQRAFDVIDEWLLELDRTGDLLGSRPDGADDACWENDGTPIARGAEEDVWAGVLDDEPEGPCTERYPPYSQARIESGGPIAADIWKCHTMPVATAVEEGLYGDWEPTAAQIERLEEIHPEGVCDYDLPDVGDPSIDVAGAPSVAAIGAGITVRDAEAGASVQLREHGDVVATTTANPAGVARFAGIDPGTYTVAQLVDGQRSTLSSPVTVREPGPGRGSDRGRGANP